MTKFDEMVSKFHALEGTTIAEKYKSLGQYLRELKTLSVDALNSLVAAIVPENRLEEFLKAELLIRNDRNAELLDLLTSGDPSLIRKVLKRWKTPQAAFRNIDGDALVNVIFPRTSYQTRTQIITALSTNLDEKLADEYFNAIDEKYGPQASNALIPSCSLGLIENRFSTNKIKLSPKALLQIVKRDKNFARFYFQAMRKIDKFTGHKQILAHIAEIDVELFWSLYREYDFDAKFGKRLTKRVLSKKQITWHFYLRNFNSKEIFNKIKRNADEFDAFFLSFYVGHVGSFHRDFCYYKDYFNQVRASERFDLINFYFKRKYGKDLLDDPKLIGAEMLEIIPVDKRELIIKDRGDYYYMYRPDKAIELIKTQLETNIYEQYRMFFQLFEVCKFHKDDDVLLQVLDCLSKVWKKELNLLGYFIGGVLCKRANLELLSTTHWDHINAIIRRLNNNPKSPLYLKNTKRMYCKGRYVIHLALNDHLMDEHVATLSQIFQLKQTKIVKIFPDSKHVKILLQSTPSHVDADVSVHLLKLAVLYNRKSKIKISLVDYLEFVDVAKKSLTNNQSAAEVIKYCVKTYDDFDETFWANYRELGDQQMLVWFATKKPSQISQHLNQILSYPEHIGDKFLTAIAKFSHLDVPETVVSFALGILRKKSNENDTKFALKSLSYLATPQDYLTAIEPFYPKIDDEENSIEEAIIESLATFKTPAFAIPPLEKFCTERFYKILSPHLRRILANVPESNSTSFLETLFQMKCARGDVVIHAAIFSKAVHRNFQNRIDEDEFINESLERFVTNPNDLTWATLLKKIIAASPNDLKQFKVLVNETIRVPPKYQSRYVEAVYEKIKVPGHVGDDMVESLLEPFGDELAILEPEFLEKIIKEMYWLPSLHLKFVFNGSSNQTRYLDAAFEALSRDGCSLESFVKEFCARITKQPSGTLLDNFGERWASAVDPEEAIEEQILFEITIRYIGSHQRDLVAFGAKCNEISTGLNDKYGPVILDVFLKPMTCFLEKIVCIREDHDKMFLFLDGFMKFNASSHAYITVSCLLSHRMMNEKYASIIERLQESKVSVVQIHFQKNLKKSLRYT